MTCALCGHQFEKEDSDSSCASCPLHTGCSRLRCPNCGYEIVETPESLQVVRKLFTSLGDKLKPYFRRNR